MCQTLLSPEDQIMNGTQVFCRWLSSTPVSDLPYITVEWVERALDRRSSVTKTKQNKTPKQKPGNLLLLAPVLVNCRVCSESGPTFLQGENSGLATGPGTELSLGFPNPARNYKEHRAPRLEAGAWLSNPHPKMLYGPNRTRYQCVGARGVTPHRPSPL